MPDFAVVRGVPEQYSDRPTERDVLLVVEVSDTTLRFDQTHKLALYATAGILESWIVNLPERTLGVYRQPEQGTYALSQTVPEDGEITSLFQQKTIFVRELLP